jgi:hypothetical protein
METKESKSAPMIDLQRENKERELPLPFRDTEKVIHNAADYQREEANEIVVHIPKNTEGFTAFTTFEVTLNKLSISDTPVNLLECWIDWPPTGKPAGWAKQLRGPIKGEPPKKLPMIIRDIAGPEDVEIIPVTEEERVIVRATKICSSTLHIKFKVPNVFYNLPGRPPFAHKRLTTNIRILNGAASSVLHLEYPKSIAMRGRTDNAEYQSLVLSIDDDYFRKATFFPQKVIHIRYTFGSADGVGLSAPGFPPLRAGIALVAFGFVLLLINAKNYTKNPGLFEIAAVVFAVSLITSFVETFQIRSLSYSAAVVDKLSWDRLSTIFFRVIHLVALLLVALLFLFVRPKYMDTPGVYFCLAGSLLFFGAWIFYFMPLALGTYQAYLCDRCERRTWIRKSLALGLGTVFYRMRLSAKLHHETRNSLCARCYNEVSKEHLEYKSRPLFARLRRGNRSPSTGYTEGLSSRPVTRPKEARYIEQEAWDTVLAGDVRIDPLPDFIDSGVIQKLKDMKLQLRFVPALQLETEKNSVQEHLRILRERYPRWKNARRLYWELVRGDKFASPKLPGQWMAIETEPKLALVEAKDGAKSLAAELGFENSRCNTSWNSIQDAIEEQKQRILSKIGLPLERTNLRLLEALEWNLLANCEGWGKTDTWEWTNTQFCGDGHMRVIIAGNKTRGGAGSMCARSPVRSDTNLGFRAVIVLDHKE